MASYAVDEEFVLVDSMNWFVDFECHNGNEPNRINLHIDNQYDTELIHTY